MPPAESIGFGTVDTRSDAQHQVPGDDLLPPADAVDPGAEQQRRADVDAMVQRCLDPAIGLACRSLDPGGSDAEGADRARHIVMRALADCARKRPSAEDDTVRLVMRRTAELCMDSLVAHEGSAVPGAGVELASLMPAAADPMTVAPGGRIPNAVLQDTLAAARATDRQVAYTVIAASVPVEDATVLLGIEPDEMQSALQRIGRKLADAFAPRPSGEVVAS